MAEVESNARLQPNQLMGNRPAPTDSLNVIMPSPFTPQVHIVNKVD